MKGAVSLWKRMSFSDQKQKDTTTTSLEHSQANIAGKQPTNSTKKNRRRGKVITWDGNIDLAYSSLC